MAINTDNMKLSDEFTKQIESVAKKAAGKHPYMCEMKKQTSGSSLILVWYMDRDVMREKMGKALRANGMNFSTGKGYVLRRKNFSSGTFYGWEYDALHAGDTKAHKIQLRFKVLSEGKRKTSNKKGPVEKKENKGIVFEKDLSKDLKVFSDTGDPKHSKIKYKDFMKSFMEDIGCSENAKKQKCINEIIDMGALNQKRPLVFSGKDILVKGRETYIGPTVTDITINVGCDKKDIYMSLKYGGTVTFVNSGVKTIFTEQQFKDREITNTNGLALLELFGIDPKKFITVFDQAQKWGQKKVPRGTTSLTKNVEVVTNKIDRRRMHQFIKTAVGWGYWLIHLQQSGKVDYFEVEQSDLARMTTPRSVVVLYPKATHPSKRIDVVIDTPKFELKLNLRNKQAGILPTHIMLDYTIKH